ncbi:MAG: hypothetical protein HGA36_00960 [Candidatus Moranbacteria bacterium]|nr:hypothetical protein [Candidatus Moranbacteria bacterium]
MKLGKYYMNWLKLQLRNICQIKITDIFKRNHEKTTMQKIPSINNGKLPNEHYNAMLGFWLPTDTPYGNFSLKLMKISSRVDEVNRAIAEVYTSWEIINANQMLPIGLYDKHVFATEKAVYHMRRLCDELISLIWCLSRWESGNGVWPVKIVTDSIGGALNPKMDDLAILEVFKKHESILLTLNEISNAFKHSFINTDHSLLGKVEPCVHALGLKKNALASDTEFYNVAMFQLVTDFDKMYQDAFGWLKVFSSRSIKK